MEDFIRTLERDSTNRFSQSDFTGIRTDEVFERVPGNLHGRLVEDTILLYCG
jgi:hypothetical protein